VTIEIGEKMPGETGRPLEGRTVVVTRARAQSASLIESLESLGADVLAFPVIQTVEPDDWSPADAAIDRIASSRGRGTDEEILTRAAHAASAPYDWIVFSSTNAVDRFFERLEDLGISLETGDARLAVVGAATAERLRDKGREPDLMPEEFTGEGLADAFYELSSRDELTTHAADAMCSFLIPRALKGRETVPEALRDLGCHVDVVPVYRTVPAIPDPDVLERLKTHGADVVTFTSPTTVNNFISVLESAGVDAEMFLHATRKASIGPVTTRALRARGAEAEIEADESTASGLVAAIVGHFRDV
jgi:uroporphyrinogen III methyltransferase/synthase